MRDLFVTMVIFGALPIVFKRPHVGIYLWCWVAYMNPHRLGWGFAHDMPFAAIIGGVTLISFVINSKERRPMPMNSVTILLFALTAWVSITTLAAIYPEASNPLWVKFMKIQVINFIIMMLIFGKERIIHLLWISVFSIAFFGIKGGIFTILTGGGERVYGAPGSATEGNNEIALAFVVIIPLMLFLRTQVENIWFKRAIILSVLLCALSTVGSYSRGAFLAGFGMAFFLWLKAEKKATGIIIMLILVPAMIAFMPDKYMDRMNTIQTYEEDSSALGRINAWYMAINLANTRPLTGGGFNSFTPMNFLNYAPDPEDPHAAHSIYFQMLGDHGYVGLLIFLLLAWFCWSTARWIQKTALTLDGQKWASDLGGMLQVSLIGFGFGGAFLSLANWDLLYELAAIIAILKVHVITEMKKVRQNTSKPAAQSRTSKNPKTSPFRKTPQTPPQTTNSSPPSSAKPQPQQQPQLGRASGGSGWFAIQPSANNQPQPETTEHKQDLSKKKPGTKQ